MPIEYWYVVDENPVSWGVGPLSLGRGRGGKLFPTIGRNQELHSFQEGVRETLRHKYGSIIKKFENTLVEVKIFIWKKLEEYQTASGRTVRDKLADATNLQKAIEDSIQGILLDNDVNVARISTEIVRQDRDASACIIICIKQYEGFDPSQIPNHVWEYAETYVGDRDNSVSPRR